jgi:hypothetical protein
MSFWNKIVDAIKGNEDFSEIKSSTFRDFLNGNILSKKFIRKQYPLLGLIAVLTLFYVDNRYNSEKEVAEEIRLKNQLQDVKYESLTISAELTKMSRRSYILDLIKSRGIDLKESDYAPVLIEEPDPQKDEKIKEEKNDQKKASEIIKKDTTQHEEYIER